MKKKILTLVAMATLVTMMTACSTEPTVSDSNPTTAPITETTQKPEEQAPTETPEVVEPTEVPEVTTEPEVTVEPTVEPTEVPEVTVEPTEIPEVVEPTAEPAEPTVEPTEAPEVVEPTVEPTEAPVEEPVTTPEPTATPVPTSTPTPEPTATPVPTEAPKAETKDWKTVLRELHSLETYAEREAYVAKLDKSAYKVEKTENFDLINKRNSGEVEISNGQKKTTGYKLISESTFETVAEYTVDNLPEEYLDAVAFSNGVEHADYGYCFFEEVYTYETNTVNAKAALDVFVKMYCDTMGNYDEKVAPVYIMTLTNIATGETDPWGVISDETTYSWEVDAQVSQTYTIEDIVTSYNRCVDKLSDDDWASEQVLYEYVEENGPVHNIETWDTFKYYEDLVSLTFTFVVEEW